MPKTAKEKYETLQEEYKSLFSEYEEIKQKDPQNPLLEKKVEQLDEKQKALNIAWKELAA